MTLIKQLTPFALALVLITFAVSLFLFSPKQSLGSVSVSSEYSATSTASNTLYGATITGSQLIRTGGGTLGQVTIEGAATGIVNFYNATTSDVSKRTGNTPTSTILIASFPASTAAGTYVFDATFSTGLYVDLISGTMPTTTITYR